MLCMQFYLYPYFLHWPLFNFYHFGSPYVSDYNWYLHHVPPPPTTPRSTEMKIFVWPLLQRKPCWSIRTGTAVWCWKDFWASKISPLKTHVSLTVISNTNYLIKDMIIKEGTWNLEAFRECPSEEVVRKIANIPLLHPLAGSYKIHVKK